MSDDCLFCKIVGGDVPAEIVHESEHAVAFRDLNPQAPTTSWSSQDGTNRTSRPSYAPTRTRRWG